MPPWLRVKTLLLIRTQHMHDVISHTEARRHGGLSTVQDSDIICYDKLRTSMIGLIFNHIHPKLRASVAPCETRRMIRTEHLHHVISHTGSYFIAPIPSSVPPCLRVKPDA